MPKRLLVVWVVVVAAQSVARAHPHDHGHGHGGSKADLQAFYSRVTARLKQPSAALKRPTLFYGKTRRDAALSNQDVFSQAVTSAFREEGEDHDDDDHDHGHESPPARMSLAKRFGHGAVKIGGIVAEGLREYGVSYAVYTGIMEAIDHGLEPVFPPFYLVQLHLVTQPAFFALARPVMLGTGVVSNRGSERPFGERLTTAFSAVRQNSADRRALKDVRLPDGTIVNRKAFRKAGGPRSAEEAMVLRSPFWGDLAAGNQVGEERAATTVAADLAAVLEDPGVKERLSRANRLGSGFEFLKGALSQAVDAAYDEGKLDTKAYLRVKNRLGSLGRIARDLQTTLATYARAEVPKERKDRARALVEKTLQLFDRAATLADAREKEALASFDAELAALRGEIRGFRAKPKPEP